MLYIIQQHVERLLTLILSGSLPLDDYLRWTLPTNGGVYRIVEDGSATGKSVYVGKAGNLRQRICTSLLKGNPQAHTLKRKLMDRAGYGNQQAARRYLQARCRVQYLELPDQSERGFFEHFAISVLQPKFND